MRYISVFMLVILYSFCLRWQHHHRHHHAPLLRHSKPAVRQALLKGPMSSLHAAALLARLTPLTVAPQEAHGRGALPLWRAPDLFGELLLLLRQLARLVHGAPVHLPCTRTTRAESHQHRGRAQQAITTVTSPPPHCTLCTHAGGKLLSQRAHRRGPPRPLPRRARPCPTWRRRCRRPAPPPWPRAPPAHAPAAPTPHQGLFSRRPIAPFTALRSPARSQPPCKTLTAQALRACAPPGHGP